MVSIYILIDPRDGAIRYVGVTARTLAERLREHLRSSVGVHRRSRWLHKLRRLGLTPTIDLIQEVPTSYRVEAECYWIGYFRALGCDLVNTTDGGDGVHGMRHLPESIKKMKDTIAARPAEYWERAAERNRTRVYTPELRAKIGAATSKRRHSEATKEQMSATRKGKPWSDARRAAGSYIRSEETREKISKTLTGKVIPLAAREKMRESANRRWESQDAHEKMRETAKRREAAKKHSA